MKKRQKVASPEPNQNINHQVHYKDKLRIEPLMKTFKKKEQLYDYSPSIKSSSHQNTSFVKIRQQKQSTQKNPQSGRLVSGRSISKGKNQKPIEKVNLNQAIYRQSQVSATSKLNRILQIFRVDLEGDVGSTLESLYDANDNYIDLLYLWQKGEHYDENDRLVYMLVQQFIKILQSCLQRSIKGTVEELESYQAQMNELLQENKRLQMQMSKLTRNSYLDQQIEQRLLDYYQQNQWSTMIFYSFQKHQFDLESYARKLQELQKSPEEYPSKPSEGQVSLAYYCHSEGGLNYWQKPSQNQFTQSYREQLLKIKIPATKSVCLD